MDMNSLQNADIVIGISYLAIPFELAFFVVRLPSMTKYQLAVSSLFVCFILFCGIGHLLEAFDAPFWAISFDRYLTAAVSAITALISPIVFSYSTTAALKYKEDQDLVNRQRDMLADAQAMTQLGNWEVLYTDRTLQTGDDDTYSLLESQKEQPRDLLINASDEWFRIFGIRISDSERHTIAIERYMALLEAEDRPRIQSVMHAAINHGTPYHIVQNAHREDDGISIVIRGYGKPIYSETGKLLGLRGTAQDITSEVEITKQLILTKEAAVLESKHKDVFLATMSHELRTPLTSIIGHVDLLEETPVTEVQHEYIGNAKRAATMLLSLINDLLDYSKLIAGIVDLEVRNVLLNDVLQDIHSILKDLGRNVILKIDAYEGPVIMGDAVRIRQILLNLVSNAVKFTMPNGFVAVTNQHREIDESVEEVTFQIRDTGIGMSHETLEKLFSPFHQADASTNRRFGGTGLGLSIVKRLVTAMKGHISVESQEGVGTTFTVTLRFKRNKDQNSSVLENGQEAPKKRALRILLAEDNRVTQLLVKRMLRNHDLDVADNGRIAVDLVQSRPLYDVMLCDINMPIMDGLEATEAIRKLENGKNLYIIGLTANAFKSDRDNCINAGMNDYLSKPFSKQGLVNVLDNAGI